MIKDIKDKVIGGYKINKEEALMLIEEELEELCESANEIREHFCQNNFDICTIINGKSGRCSENCKFCAQSSYYNTASEVYSLLESKEILKDAKYNNSKGILRYSIVTSGKRLSKNEVKLVCERYKMINSETSLSLCASHGLLDYEDFIMLKKSGVTRYHNNLKTSRNNFENICTTHTYDDKIDTLKAAQKAGLDICSGGIIGLGESMEDRIDMALDLRSISVKSIPINILNPIKGTPFESIKCLAIEDVRRVVAIYRFILPDAALRLAGGRILVKENMEEIFKSGANAVISGDMLTTMGVGIDTDISMINKLGFKINKI